MPTAAKLVAGILFAGLAWLVADMIARTALPEGTRVGWFREVLAAGGVFVGWRWIGREATGPTGRGTTTARAVTAGIGASAVLLVLGIVIHAFGRMIANSLGGKYGDLGPALSAWMAFVWDDARMVGTVPILGLLFAGGAFVGLVSGLIGRRWG